MSFEAKFKGFCYDCESPIEVGDLVEYTEGTFQDELVHVGCAPKIERATVTCTTCWLIKPCECDDIAKQERRNNPKGTNA